MAERQPNQRRAWRRVAERSDPETPRSLIPGGPSGTLHRRAELWSLVLLCIVPILYVGFALTVGASRFGMPLYLRPWIDRDYWWHLGTGRWILDHGQIPRVDPFLWTYGGRWIAHEWLGEMILAVIDRLGAYKASIVFTLALAAIGHWTLMLAARLYGLAWTGCLAVTLLWGGSFYSSIYVRPQFWSLTFLAILLAAIAAYDTGRIRRLWWLFPLFLAWVNVNLTVIFGLICLATFVLDRFIRHRPIDRHSIAVGVLCGSALLINPFGPYLLEAIWKYRGANEIWHQRIFEWMAPNWGDPATLPFLLALPMSGVAVWQVLRRRIWPAVPLLLLLHQSLQAVRFIPLYVMLSMVFAGWLFRQRVRRGLLPPRPWVFLPPAAAGIALATVLTVASTAQRSQFREVPIAWGYPVIPATIIQEKLPSARIFNLYDFGGYLIYRLKGAPKIFIDGRGEMYGRDFLREYFDLIDGEGDWQRRFSDRKIDTVLVRPEDGIAEELSTRPDWQELFRNDSSVLFVRRPSGSEPAGGQREPARLPAQ